MKKDGFIFILIAIVAAVLWVLAFSGPLAYHIAELGCFK